MLYKFIYDELEELEILMNNLIRQYLIIFIFFAATGASHNITI